MRAVVLGASALVLGLTGALGVLHAADRPAVTVAVLRGDGILIPIATRQGDKWTNTWPVPAKAADVPLELGDVPKRWWGKPGPTARWHAWQIDGSSSQVEVERPTWYLAHCQQGVGLRTSLTAQPPVPPPTVQPYPKLGLAASAPVAFRRIEPVGESDPIWMKVADRIDEALKAEESLMNGMPSMNVGFRPRHPVPATERTAVPTRVESLYRLAGEGGSGGVYYVEATRRYGLPPGQTDKADKAPAAKPACSTMTFGNGFFRVDGTGDVPKPTLRVTLSSCDYDDVSLMLPLAAVADRGEPVWIVQITGWDYESYVGFRWDGTRGAMTEAFGTRGGWCVDDGGW